MASPAEKGDCEYTEASIVSSLGKHQRTDELAGACKLRRRLNMLKKVLVIAAMSIVAAPVSADHAARARAEKVIELKDGSTLYLFKDGKMALEDRYGRAARMKLGHVVETKDGQKITMHSDEVMRLNGLLREEHGGGRP